MKHQKKTFSTTPGHVYLVPVVGGMNRTAYYPVTLVPVLVHNFLNTTIAQNIRVLFYSNPQSRCDGQFFLHPCKSTLTVTYSTPVFFLLITNSWIFCSNFAAFPHLKFGDFVVSFLACYDFFTDINRVQYPVGSKEFLI